MYTKPDAPDYIDVKGLQLVRRDNAPIVKDVSNAILNTVMYERSPEKAITYARESVLRVLRNEEPLEKFIISKALRNGYKNPDSLPHVIVARKLQQRRGFPPASGERVPYVFIRDSQNPDGLQAQRAEDPGYVKENPDIVELDTLYYINNQLLAPITTLLEVLMDSPEHVHKEIMGHPEIAPLVNDLHNEKTAEIKVAKRVRLNTKNKQHEITRFFVKK
jgi:DNA polymerase delta subunit 1